MTERNGYTPSQHAILEVLSDGDWHHRDELQAVLGVELQPLYQLVSDLRKKLESRGETIVCSRRNRRPYYRHLRLLPEGMRRIPPASAE